MKRRTFLSLAAFSPIAAFAQDQKPDALPRETGADAEIIPMKGEIRKDFQLAYYKMTTDNLSLQLMINQFMKQNPDAARLQSDLAAQNSELQRLEALAFHESGLDQKEYRINPETANFEKIAK